MSEWRHRGFVDDSEEELSSDSGRASLGLQIEEDTTKGDVTRLDDHDCQASSPLTGPESSQENQYDDGSQKADWGLVPSSRPEERPDAPDTDFNKSALPVRNGSPFPTLEDYGIDSLWLAAPSAPQHEQPAASLRSITDNAAPPTPPTVLATHQDQQRNSSTSGDEESRPAQRRNLRSRKFVQLHPYLLDRQQHKEQMHARGLKPFRIVTDHDEASEKAHENLEEPEDEDENSITTATQSQDSPRSISKPIPVSHSFRDEDDLPDIDALFRRKVDRALQLGFKRRKVYAALDCTSNRPNLVDGFDVPPSPSNSINSSLSSLGPQSQDHFKPAVFHMPRGPSPACLPTPVTSSEIRRPSKAVVEVLSDSELEPPIASARSRRLRESSPTSTASKTPTSPSSGVDEAREILWARKRIKGVLPASWLRLDKQTQKTRAGADTTPEPTLSPLRSSKTQRGVAQRKHIRTDASPINRNETIYILDDGSDMLRPVSPILQDLEGVDSIDPMLPSALQDLEEEDFIDPMLPSVPRRRSTGQHRKKQSKLPFTRLKKPPDVQRQRRSAPLTKSVPRLSILDAPQVSTTRDMPPFIKVALRRVRKRKDAGRHSPTAKAIRLQTRQDTVDAQGTLRDWRSGNIKAVPAPAHGRTPLSERAANNQRPPPLRKGYQSIPRLLSKPSQQHGVGLRSGKKAQPPNVIRRPRKRPARRLDIEAIEYRQPSEEPVQAFEDVTPDKPSEEGLLQGLGPFGTRYTWTFDVVPLHMGTFFHESTFLGSGGLQKAVELTARNLEAPAGYTTIHGANNEFRWGSYTEEVASELETAFQQMQDEFAAGQVSAMAATRTLRSVVTYYTESLNFLDPIDACLFSAKSFRLCDGLFSVIAMETATADLLTGLTCLLVLADETYQVALYAGLADSEQDKARRLVTQIGAALLKAAIIDDNSVLRRFLEDNKQDTIRERGVRESEVVVESVVIAAQILGQARHTESSFWIVVDGLLMQLLTEPLAHVNTLERIWEKIFLVLPLLEIDITGVSKPGQRFHQPAQENWKMVRQMLSRLFAVYSSASLQRQAPTFNEYLRANLARVHHLIQAWGWRKCESVIGTVFDFFAGNGLAQLSNEDGRGSAPFLRELDQSPALTVERQDRSFHIFLKIIGTGMQNMRQVYSDKRLRSIAWRLIPNHGRTYRKEDAIHQEDLDALRNHHDLLCTLYWACPPDARPRLDLVRNLVDHASSHREACLLNIRAWANLARFQLSADEPISSFPPFGEWLNEILQHSILQHKLAKTEAENHFELSKAASAGVITKQLVYTTVSKNQKEVEAALSDALLSMKEVLTAARNEEAASVLLQATGITSVFRMFDPNNSRLGKVVCQALDVYTRYMELFVQKGSCSTSEDSEESQDYGDFSAFDDLVTSSEPPQSVVTVLDMLFDPVAQLLSSCFGSETAADEMVLIKVVDTWSMLADCLVKSGKRTWSNYIDEYTPFSWRQLRDTDHKRKFGVYFMSSMVKLDSRSYRDNAESFNLELLSSLVERESMLKFQHLLLSSLLNVDSGNKILLNLPFRAKAGSLAFEISLTELREGRLSVISSILSNMRESFEDAMHNHPDGLVQLRQEYSTLLKHLMTRMKRNYQELGHGSDVRGTYVEFVHRVVEFLQQHTSDICHVDKFFTDSSAFPLPARDPTYVVGRLKSYAVKLTDGRSQKQLAVFVRTICERAATDNQQSYLVAQLHAAMRNTFETGDPGRPTLTRLLLEGVFPAYIKQALRSECAWILARPILQTSKLVLEELLYNVSISHAASVASAVRMATATLCAVQKTTDLVIENSALLQQPSAACVLREMFNSITAAVPLVDYIHRASSQASLAVMLIRSIRSFALFVAATVLGHSDIRPPTRFEAPATLAVQEPTFANLQDFCDNELQQALNKGWVKHGDFYYIVRGGMRSEVMVDLGTPEAEKRALLDAIEDFFGVLGRTTVFQ